MNPLLCRHQPATHFQMVPCLAAPLPQKRDIHDEEDLASVAIQVQKKRFYVDVKKNRRGIFMKIAEVGSDGRKARILLTMLTANEIRDKLKELIDVLEDVQKKEEADSTTQDKVLEESRNGPGPYGDGLIKTYTVSCPYRRYYLDLKRNRRGHFLRLTMLSTFNRTHLVIPSQGMADLYDALNDLLNKWWDGSDSNRNKVNLPESKSLRLDNKTLYFDSSFNRFGAYLRISEVRTQSRTAITIPGSFIIRFRDIINGLTDDLTNVKVEKKEELEQSPSDEPDTSTEPSPVVNGDVS